MPPNWNAQLKIRRLYWRLQRAVRQKRVQWGEPALFWLAWRGRKFSKWLESWESPSLPLPNGVSDSRCLG